MRDGSESPPFATTTTDVNKESPPQLTYSCDGSGEQLPFATTTIDLNQQTKSQQYHLATSSPATVAVEMVAEVMVVVVTVAVVMVAEVMVGWR